MTVRNFTAHCHGIDWEIEEEELPGKTMKWTCRPLIESYDPGLRTVVAVCDPEGFLDTDEDDIAEHLFYQLIEDVFRALDGMRQKNCLDNFTLFL